jgi:hypothetical protein
LVRFQTSLLGISISDLHKSTNYLLFVTVHRLRLSKARQGIVQSEETRRKISLAVAFTKRSLKKQRLAARAAEAAEAATADLRPAFSGIYSGSTGGSTSTSRDWAEGGSGYSSGGEYSDGGGAYSGSEGESDYEEERIETIILNPMELEKAVIEVTALRRQLTAWMDAYEKKFGRKPDLTEASETHPLVYGRFVRYVALRELVRTSSLMIGSTPVSWN